MDTKISIIIPLYNKEKSITSTIQSVLNQSYHDFEVIIINDGSTDNSFDIVNSFDDNRIHIFNKENEGVSKARNLGVELATSELIAFLDADDTMYDNCLQNLLELREDYPKCDMWAGCFCNTYMGKVLSYFGNLNYGIITNPHRKFFNEQFQIRTGNFIMTKSSFLELGGFSTDITVGEDFLLFDDFLARYQCAYTPKVTMQYVQDMRSLSTGNKPKEVTIDYNLCFKNKNIWQKLIYSQIITKHIIIDACKKGGRDVVPFLRKYHIWCLVGVVAILINVPVLLKTIRGGKNTTLKLSIMQE